MTNHLHKVTAFILRQAPQGPQLLLIQHPHAGIQLPAGTVEPDEDPFTAARREASEETGLVDLPEPVFIHSRIYPAPEQHVYTRLPSPVYSRPDETSFNCAHFRSGLVVKLLRRQAGFTQVAFEEPDTFPNTNYISYNITGWVPQDALTETQMRHFYRFDYPHPAPPRWNLRTDNHLFTLFWVPLANLPPIIPPQDQWVDILRQHQTTPPRPGK